MKEAKELRGKVVMNDKSSLERKTASKSDDKTLRKSTSEKIKPECPKASVVALYYINRAELELCFSEFSPLHGSLSVLATREILHPIWRRK